MSAEKRTIRLEVLLINGTLTLFLGLALLYLQGIMTGILFDVVAATMAVVLSASVFIMIAIVDFCAAAGSGIKRLRDVIFYSLIGLAFIVGALFVASGALAILQVLLALVIVHGLVSGSLGFVAAQKSSSDPFTRITFFGSAIISIVISGIVTGIVRDLDGRTAFGWIGAYLCLVGIKMLILAGSFQYQNTSPSKTAGIPVERLL